MQTMLFGLLPQESMRQPDNSPTQEPLNTTEATSLLSPQALRTVYAAIAATVAAGLLAELFFNWSRIQSHFWPVGWSLACVGLGLWITLNVSRARAPQRVGFVLLLCLSQISWAGSLDPGSLPSGMILLPIVAGAWASVTRRSRVLTWHGAAMLCTMLVIGAIAGVLPGGSAYGTNATSEWVHTVMALALCVFCGTAVNRALQYQLRQLQGASGALQASEDARHDGQQFLQAIIDTSPYAIAAIELRSGQTMLVNDAFEKLLGFSRSELQGRDMGEQLQIEGGARELVHQTRKASGRLLNLTLTVRNRAGERRVMRGGGSIFALHGREYYLWVTRDVTDERLMQMERDAIFATSPIGIFTERDGLIRVISAELERWMGWSQGSGALRPVATLVGGENALREMRSRCEADLRSGRPVSLEWPMFRADGAPFTARFSGRSIEHGAGAHNNDPTTTVWIVQDVSEEVERQRLLEIARIRAEDGARTKSRFLVNMSHQLRTPMNALLNLAELAKDIENDAQQRHLVGHVAGTAQALASLLSDILDLSSLEEGSMLLVIEDFHLGHLIDRIDATFQPLVRQRGLFLKVHLGPGCDTWISTDARRMRQIITNLLNHALNCCTSGSIELTLIRTDSGRLRIEVRADGLEVAPADQERLFTAFDGPAKVAERETGTALGLAICRDLARLMRGDVGVVVSDAVTAGSTLWAELPLTLARRIPAQAGASSGVPPSLIGVRVLLVEDEELSSVALTLMLQRWGMHVEPVSDGMQAVRRALAARDSGRPFDLVLMDLHLPFMHGTEATRWLRREGLSATQLPILVLTAGSLVSEREEALQAGANDFISKPVDADELRQHIGRLLPRATSVA
ncbi:MAG: response regulator [Betaproteobacteria bacterium]|nr:response regulator [Betaproteobacteria bacterium]